MGRSCAIPSQTRPYPRIPALLTHWRFGLRFRSHHHPRAFYHAQGSTTYAVELDKTITAAKSGGSHKALLVPCLFSSALAFVSSQFPGSPPWPRSHAIFAPTARYAVLLVLMLKIGFSPPHLAVVGWQAAVTAASDPPPVYSGKAHRVLELSR